MTEKQLEFIKKQIVALIAKEALLLGDLPKIDADPREWTTCDEVQFKQAQLLLLYGIYSKLSDTEHDGSRHMTIKF